jgi:flavodoxin
MSKILIVYCSMSGNTKAAAEAVADGALGQKVIPYEDRDHLSIGNRQYAKNGGARPEGLC